MLAMVKFSRSFVAISLTHLALLNLFGCNADVSSETTGTEGGSAKPEKSLKLNNDECLDPDLSLLSSAESLMMCDGSIAKGTLDLTNLAAANIKSGIAIGGVTGTLTGGSAADCASDGELGCVTTAAYLAADMASVLPANIKSGITIAGVAGNYAPDFPAVGNVLNSDTVNGVSGTLTLPAVGKVFLGTNYGVAGTGSTGTLTLPTAANVLTGSGTYGDPGAAVTPSYSPDFPSAANVRASDTTNGANGLIANCAAGDSACYVPTYAPSTQPLKAISFDSITAGIVKKNSVIAGITGDYPSATYPLTGATGTADLDTATFDAKIKDGVTNFEWFDSEGTQYSRAGDSDIVAGNIVNTANIFGLAGSAVAPTAPDPWDVRAGQTINGVTGKLKVACRNTTNTSVFDAGTPKNATADNTTDFFTVAAHGYSDNDTIRFTARTTPSGLTANSTTYYVRNSTTNTFQLSTSSGGAAINFTTDGLNVVVYKWGEGTRDIWDTIDDFNDDNGPMTVSDIPAAWTSDNYCGGVGTASGSEVWTDTTADGACDSAGDECRFKDKITRLEWSEIQSTGTSWGLAMTTCSGLSFGGAGAWRLPTQKELMTAYEHGIYSVQNANWITKLQMDNQFFWSSTSYSANLPYAWIVYLSYGETASNLKTGSTIQAVCVR